MTADDLNDREEDQELRDHVLKPKARREPRVSGSTVGSSENGHAPSGNGRGGKAPTQSMDGPPMDASDMTTPDAATRDGTLAVGQAPWNRNYTSRNGTSTKPILDKATILYIWVAPEESRRKNDARTDPNDPGSILHHGVPIEVMMGDYGCDDVDHLLEQSSRPDTVTIEAHGTSYTLPLARFDNRVDKTSFVRNERSDWKEDEVAALHEERRHVALRANLLTGVSRFFVVFLAFLRPRFLVVVLLAFLPSRFFFK